MMAIKVNSKKFLFSVRATMLHEQKYPYVALSGDGNLLALSSASREEQGKATLEYSGVAFKKTIVSSKMLGAIVPVLEGDDVTITFKDKKLLLSDGSSNFEIPEVEEGQIMSFRGFNGDPVLGELKLSEKNVDDLGFVAQIINPHEDRPAFMGMHVLANADTCTFVGMGMSALAVQTFPYKGDDFSVLMAPEIVRRLKAENTLVFSANQTEVKSGDSEYYLQNLISSGDISGMIEKATSRASQKEVQIKRLDLVRAAEKVALISSVGEGGHEVAAVLNGVPGGKSLKLSAMTSQGAAEAEIPLLKNAPWTEYYRQGVNVKFLLALKKRSAPILDMNLGSVEDRTAFSVGEHGNDTFNYVFAPMRLR